MDDNPYSALNVDNHVAPKSRQTRVVKSFNPFQLGKLLGIFYALVSLLIVPIFILISLAGNGNNGISLLVVLIVPVMYGVFGVIGVVIGGVAYNVCAKIVGGIEIEIE
ncbi:MAG: hypothetical protein JWN70_6584 [Planctomycetaceae bacterium]|nr:hypothetical protein [Planctomycetaceae bacterium]